MVTWRLFFRGCLLPKKSAVHFSAQTTICPLGARTAPCSEISISFAPLTEPPPALANCSPPRWACTHSSHPSPKILPPAPFCFRSPLPQRLFNNATLSATARSLPSPAVPTPYPLASTLSLICNIFAPGFHILRNAAGFHIPDLPPHRLCVSNLYPNLSPPTTESVRSNATTAAPSL